MYIRFKLNYVVNMLLSCPKFLTEYYDTHMFKLMFWLIIIYQIVKITCHYFMYKIGISKNIEHMLSFIMNTLKYYRLQNIIHLTSG